LGDPECGKGGRFPVGVMLQDGFQFLDRLFAKAKGYLVGIRWLGRIRMKTNVTHLFTNRFFVEAVYSLALSAWVVG
jgi:hypothetical protein